MRSTGENGVIVLLVKDPFYHVYISYLSITKGLPDHCLSSTMLDKWCQTLLQLLIFFCFHKCSSFCFKHLKKHFFLIFLHPMSVFFGPSWSLPLIGQSQIWPWQGTWTLGTEPGVLHVLFKKSCQLRTCEISVSQTRNSDILVLLLSCAPIDAFCLSFYPS